MHTKRKILFLMPSLRGGGAERTLINLLHKIDYDRYDVDLIVVSKYGVYTSQIPDEVDVTYLFKNNYLVRVLGYLQRSFHIEWFFKRKMARIDKNYDVGISFLDSNYTDLLFYTDAIEKRIAFIHASYLTHSNYKKLYRFEKYKRKLKEDRYSKLDGIYFVSQDSMNDFKELFGKFAEMDVVYNMIDKENVEKKAAIKTNISERDIFSFTAVGSLMAIKGFDRLIRASRIVKEQGYKFKVHILGAGPEERSLKKLIKELDLENEITLHGFVENPYPQMKNSYVFVMSSLSEGLPTVLCEAMILGIPSLVTDCSGCRGLVEDNIYGLTARQDDKDFAKKMMLYMDEPELLKHYSEKSLERAKLFDDDRILRSYYKIFDT